MHKIIYLTMALALLSQWANAQSTTVTFGRYGNCNSGRGICTIEEAKSKTGGNANLILHKQTLILQILTEHLKPEDKQRLTQAIITSPAGYFNIEEGFDLDQIMQLKIEELGANFRRIEKRKYPVELHPGRVDIYLTKF